ncbi:MAG: 50S ribosomal protein L1 [Chloroflexota bacterium]|nr:50S ribosomal protein L1 [Chloroflexota bacterium]
MAGKKYAEALKKIDRERLYEPRDAVALVKELATAKFDETVEVHIRTGVDPRHADQVVRGSAALPAGTGKTRRVIAFAAGDKAREAEEAGADVAGGEELVARIQGGWLDFDVAVATPDMMGIVGRLGRVLGPRGLMPNPRTGTVTPDVGRVIREVKGGRIDFRVDRTAVIHMPIGRVSFDEEKLLQNLTAAIDAVVRAKPSAARGQYIRSITLTTTMGPGIKLDIQPTLALAATAA